jgi:hypothetical protein
MATLRAISQHQCCLLTHTLPAYWRGLLDGRHRVSVAYYHGVEWIEAYVTECRTQFPEGRRNGGDTMSNAKRDGPTETADVGVRPGRVSASP